MKYIILALCVALVFLGLQCYWLKKDNQQLLKNEGIYKTQINELAEADKANRQKIELCNQRTRELATEGEKRAEAAEKARKEAEISGRENKKLADRLLAMKADPKKTSCEQAEDVAKGYLKERKARENPTRPN